MKIVFVFTYKNEKILDYQTGNDPSHASSFFSSFFLKAQIKGKWNIIVVYTIFFYF